MKPSARKMSCLLAAVGLSTVCAVRSAVPPQPPLRMVALDLDGTLLNRQHEASAAAVETLRELHALGVVVALCSGRSQAAMFATARLLQLPDVPLVCFNGALGLRCTAAFLAGQEPEPLELFATPVPDEAARAVLRHAAQRGELVQYYAGRSIHVACLTEDHLALTREYAALTGVAAHVYDESYQCALSVGAPFKMLLMTRDVDSTLGAAQAAFPPSNLHLIRGTPPFFVECLHPLVNKGEGLRRLCGALGIPLSEVVAFGDGDNDAEFIQLAGLGLAMANGRQLLKDVADGVTDYSNDEDGVARALRKLMREGRFGQAAAEAAARSAEEAAEGTYSGAA